MTPSVLEPRDSRRIHAIGFTTIFSQARFGENTGVRFAPLVRLLCERNGGACVALNSLTP